MQDDGVARKMEMGRKPGNERRAQKDESPLAFSNDKWRPQDCASDIQLARPCPPFLFAFFLHHLRPLFVSSNPYDVRCRARTHPLVENRPGWLCLLLTFNQQSPIYCSTRIHTSPLSRSSALPYFPTRPAPRFPPS